MALYLNERMTDRLMRDILLKHMASVCSCGAWIDSRQFDAGICICPKCQALDEEKARLNLVALDLSKAGMALHKSMAIRPWGVKN